MILSQNILKCLGAVFSGKNLIAHAAELREVVAFENGEIQKSAKIFERAGDLRLESSTVEFLPSWGSYLEANVAIFAYR